jgi:hypothetical protein
VAAENLEGRSFSHPHCHYKKFCQSGVLARVIKASLTGDDYLSLFLSVYSIS